MSSIACYRRTYRTTRGLAHPRVHVGVPGRIGLLRTAKHVSKQARPSSGECRVMHSPDGIRRSDDGPGRPSTAAQGRSIIVRLALKRGRRPTVEPHTPGCVVPIAGFFHAGTRPDHDRGGAARMYLWRRGRWFSHSHPRAADWRAAASGEHGAPHRMPRAWGRQVSGVD